MCGRFALRLGRDRIRQLPGYNIDVDEWENEEEFVPRYNIAPRTQAPVLRRRGTTDDSELNDSSDKLILQTMKWGLVPHWSKFEDKTLSTTNARAENLVEGGGMWGSLRGSKRCVIPVQGYYEWLTRGKQKLPHFTKRKDEGIMLLAGLYDSAVIEGKHHRRTLWTFTIVTTDANSSFSWLHDRQPVILSSTSAVLSWLEPTNNTWTKQLTQLVQPYSDKNVELDCYQVPQEVGRVGTESETFIEPVKSRKDGIQAMFMKQKEKKTEGKRKRETVEIKDEDKETSKRATTEDGEKFKPGDQVQKPAKKLKSESSSSDIKPTPSSSQSSERKPKPSPTKKKASPQKPTDVKPITAFFSKK
ncbi:hypothetical protein D9756_008100 [Leucocoprinus leucothites]|uniref:DUF159-domain-containing protein n=1 Tax=Leucocoprinus leucothites TaxID=201217 RepID=A0A8H5D4R0_9AGAR|nr:hypothetical protein D9756_008100 [Leucoagaricus leucothites]